MGVGSRWVEGLPLLVEPTELGFFSPPASPFLGEVEEGVLGGYLSEKAL